MLDVIFLSYDEPNAEQNFQRLRNFAPLAKRVHGVQGIAQAHRAAAQLSSSSHFFLIDADNWVLDNFANILSNQEEPAAEVCLWTARNAVNGLRWYNGALKLLSRDAVLSVDLPVVDFFLSIGGRRILSDEIATETRFNASPFFAWRAAFRECTKLAGGIINTSHTDELLRIWQTVGAEQSNGEWCIAGARMGAAFGAKFRGSDQIYRINDMQWLKAVFDDARARQSQPHHMGQPGFQTTTAKLHSAQMLRQQGRFQDAKRLLEEIVRAEPGNADALHQLGIIALFTGDAQSGTGLIRQAVALKPDNAAAWNDLGYGQLSLAHYEDSLASCGKAIALKPNSPEAYNNRAVALNALGRYDEAIACCHEALALRGGYPEAHFNCGNALLELRRCDDALAQYDRAVALNPGYAEAFANRANTLAMLNRHNEAVTDYNTAIALKPELTQVHVGRGNALRALGRYDEAIASYDSALAQKPDHVEALINRGISLFEMGRFEDAIAIYDKALAFSPNLATLYNNRANAANELSRFSDALKDYDAAIALKPDYAVAYYNRASALKNLGRIDEALASYRKAIALDPDYASAYNNLGYMLYELGQFDEAMANFDRAIALAPQFRGARHNRGVLLLLQGRFTEGFLDNEYRNSLGRSEELSLSPQSQWRGESIAGKTLFIHSELFFGDMLHFCRYAKMAEALGARVILSVQPSLRQLLTHLSPTIEIVSEDQEPPLFDYHCPLLSLPLAFGTTVDTIPGDVPYLRAEDERVRKWKSTLGDGGFKIGICWQGSTLPYAVALQRSCALLEFYGISKLPGVRLISLQKSDGKEQLALLPEDMTVETLGDDFDAGPDAFLDTAAVMESLDLVVTVDTAIAHLAGALARPTYVVTKHVPDWRWLLDRRDSPWYPTMRLFRQKQIGDWRSAFAEIENELGELMAKSATPA